MYLGQMQDVFALPGTVVAGLSASHARADAATTDAGNAAGNSPGLLDPLRKLLRQSKEPAETISRNDQAISTPPQWSADSAFRIPALKIKLDRVCLSSNRIMGIVR